MNWLTREFTAIGKVRRNVVLLSSLAGLLAFFPVRTDEIGFFGARFTSDVVAFGIFHSLVFYTLMLGMRAYVHRRLAQFESYPFRAELQAKIEQTRLRIDEANKATKSARAQRRMVADITVTQLTDQIAGLQMRMSELAAIARDGGDEAVASVTLEAICAKEEIARCERQRAQAQALLNEQADATSKSELDEQLALLQAQGPFESFVNKFITIGEYSFPCVLGAITALLLFVTQDFPMLWELQLR